MITGASGSARVKVIHNEPSKHLQDLGVQLNPKRFEIVSPPLTESRARREHKSAAAILSTIYHSSISIDLARISRDTHALHIFFSDGIEEWHNMTKNSFLTRLGLKQHFPAYSDVYFTCTIGAKRMLEGMGKMVFMYVPKKAAARSSLAETKVPDYNFLISTANTPFFNESELLHLLELIRIVVKEADSLGLSYAFRVFDSRIIAELGIDPNRNMLDCDISNALHRADALITTPSSVSITAIQLNKPVGTLDYRDGPLLFQTGWRLHKSVSIRQVLIDMLAEDEERMTFQQTQIRSSMTHQEASELAERLILQNEVATEKLFKGRRGKYAGTEHWLRLVVNIIRQRSVAFKKIVDLIKRR